MFLFRGSSLNGVDLNAGFVSGKALAQWHLLCTAISWNLVLLRRFLFVALLLVSFRPTTDTGSVEGVVRDVIVL